MASFNRVILMGNLTRDPDVRATGATGMKVARLSVAVNERRKDRFGNIQDYPVFVEVDAWDKLAELCGQYLYKGRGVLVEGRLQMDSWEKDGQKHQKLKVRAATIKFLPQPDYKPGQNNRNAASAANASSTPAPAAPMVEPPSESDPDDTPF